SGMPSLGAGNFAGFSFANHPATSDLATTTMVRIQEASRRARQAKSPGTLQCQDLGLADSIHQVPLS
ncbi:MAG: hypothetical protein NTX25_10985, partial [Proteobacteria bacterium]|nr:hypothetical protein [Pseudomonadota bacterium]